MANNKISISKLKAGDVLEKLRFAFIADRVSLIKAFKDIGITVKDERDLEILSELNKRGMDKKGLESSDGKKLKLDINKFLDDIRLRDRYVENCNIVFVE